MRRGFERAEQRLFTRRDRIQGLPGSRPSASLRGGSVSGRWNWATCWTTCRLRRRRARGRPSSRQRQRQTRSQPCRARRVPARARARVPSPSRVRADAPSPRRCCRACPSRAGAWSNTIAQTHKRVSVRVSSVNRERSQ